jgi:hypothetical protein
MRNEVYYIWNLLIKFIINKGFSFEFEPTTRLSSNDSRKEPKKLQKEGTEEEGVSTVPKF